MRVMLLIVFCLIMAINVNAETSFTGYRQQFLSVDKSDVCKLVFRDNLNKEGKLYFSMSLIDEGSNPIKHDTKMPFDITFNSNDGKTYLLEKQSFKNNPLAKLSDLELMSIINKAKESNAKEANIKGGHFVADVPSPPWEEYASTDLTVPEPGSEIIVINPGASIASGQLIDDEQIIKLIQSGQIKSIKVKIHEADGDKDYSFN